MKLRTAKILSHICVVLFLMFLVHSLKNYLLVRDILLPNLATLSKLGAAIVDPQGAQQVWLSTVEAYEAFALFQVIGWSVAWVLSLVTVIALHRFRPRSG